jgi:hypothetical protein
MKIEDARKLKVGDMVKTDEGGDGDISHIGESTCVNVNSTKYCWITLKAGGVWPSNRLTKVFMRKLEKYI